MRKIVITRHKALIAYLKEIGIIDDNAIIYDHIDDPSVLEGSHVYGVLPNHLACKSKSLTEIPISIPKELRGQELSIEQIREFAQEPVTYEIRKV